MMRTLRNLLWPLVMVLSLFMFASVYAYADTGTAPLPDPPQNLGALLPMLGLAIASLGSYGLRYLSAKYDFFHNGIGKAAITVLGSTIASVLPFVQSGKFNLVLLAWAAVGAVSSFAATLSPSLIALNNASKEQP